VAGDGAGRGGGRDAGDRPAVVADGVGEEEAPAAGRVADRGDLNNAAAEVVAGEDRSLEFEMRHPASEIARLRGDRDVAVDAVRDGGAVADHLPGEATATFKSRYHVAPQRR
jgi:hypothetical protein